MYYGNDKKLEREVKKQDEEIKCLKAQLLEAQQENQKLKDGIFGMSCELSGLLIGSYNAEYDSSVDTGMLTGRPEDEMPVLQSDILKELAKLHKHAWKAMKNMAKALWPSDVPPERMEGLANLFKGARRCFELWEMFACREGTREAWAMVKTCYTGLDPNHMARIGPQGPDGKETPVSLVYDQVMTAATFSQQDCKLDSLLDGVERE